MFRDGTKARKICRRFFFLFEKLGYSAVLKIAKLIYIAIFLYFAISLDSLIDLQCYLDLPPLYSMANPVACSDLNIVYIKNAGLLNVTLYGNVLDSVLAECDVTAQVAPMFHPTINATNIARIVALVLGVSIIVLYTLIVLHDKKLFYPPQSDYGIHYLQWIFFATTMVSGILLVAYEGNVSCDVAQFGMQKTWIGTYCSLPSARVQVLVNFAWFFFILAGIGTLSYAGYLVYHHYFTEAEREEDRGVKAVVPSHSNSVTTLVAMNSITHGHGSKDDDADEI